MEHHAASRLISVSKPYMSFQRTFLPRDSDARFAVPSLAHHTSPELPSLSAAVAGSHRDGSELAYPPAPAGEAPVAAEEGEGDTLHAAAQRGDTHAVMQLFSQVPPPPGGPHPTCRKPSFERNAGCWMLRPARRVVTRADGKQLSCRV